MDYVYITGCDTGFGNILTKMLDKAGKVGVFSGCYLQASVETMKSECSDRVVPLQLDVAKEQSVENCAEQIKRHLASKPGSRLVGVVNNAGILVSPGPVEWTPIDSYRRMFDVNVLGTVMVTKSVMALIRKSQGRIVNVASIAGRVGLPSQPAYCGSKYMVEAFSDILRKDMIPWGVTVHIIEPGVFSKTGLYDSYQTGLDKLWEDLPQNLKDEYGEDYYVFYRKMLGNALLEFGNTNSNLVPEAMFHALTSSQPKYRYRVGFDSKYLITVVEKLHESTQDAIFMAGNPKLKNVDPKGAPKNGKQIANARYPGAPYKWWALAIAIIFLVRRMRQ